jgi:heme/copper-type cytochrome/quinol oxidase subunit 2
LYWVIVAIIAVVVLSILAWGIRRFRGRRMEHTSMEDRHKDRAA